jgi:hypothetical protein
VADKIGDCLVFYSWRPSLQGLTILLFILQATKIYWIWNIPCHCYNLINPDCNPFLVDVSGCHCGLWQHSAPSVLVTVFLLQGALELPQISLAPLEGGGSSLVLCLAQHPFRFCYCFKCFQFVVNKNTTAIDVRFHNTSLVNWAFMGDSMFSAPVAEVILWKYCR